MCQVFIFIQNCTMKLLKIHLNIMVLLEMVFMMDTIAIQKLFDSGVAIRKLPNKYLITSPIIVNNECRIIGNAMEKIVINHIYTIQKQIYSLLKVM